MINAVRCCFHLYFVASNAPSWLLKSFMHDRKDNEPCSMSCTGECRWVIDQHIRLRPGHLCEKIFAAHYRSDYHIRVHLHIIEATIT